MDIWDLAEALYPLNRCLNSESNRKTLEIIREFVGEFDLRVWEVGKNSGGWKVPPSWICKEGTISNEDDGVIVDFNECALHVASHSVSVDERMDWADLKDHLIVGSQEMGEVRYATCYYNNDWRFSVTSDQYNKLKDKKNKVHIDSRFDSSHGMDYGELLIEGQMEDEILVSSYICHPSMANNEVSGMCVLAELAKRFRRRSEKPRMSLRFILVPETIGSVMYIADNIDVIKKKVRQGLILTCLGDKTDGFSYPDVMNETSILRKALESLNKEGIDLRSYPFDERGSDERQFGWPTVGVDCTSISRSKYHEYKEYHTSLDSLDIISEEQLIGSCEFIECLIERISENRVTKSTTLGEPFMSGLGLHTGIGGQQHHDSENVGKKVRDIMWCSNGLSDTFDISMKTGLAYLDVLEIQRLCIEKGICVCC